MSKARYIGTIKCLLQDIDVNIKDLLQRYTKGDNSLIFRYFYKIKECHTLGEKVIVTADIFITETINNETNIMTNHGSFDAELYSISKAGKNNNKVPFYLNATSNILLPISTFILFNGWFYHREFLMLSNNTIALNATYMTIIVSLLGLLCSLLFLTINIRSLFFYIYLLNFGVFSLCLYRTVGEDRFSLYALILLMTVLIGLLLNKITKKTIPLHHSEKLQQPFHCPPVHDPPAK